MVDRVFPPPFKLDDYHPLPTTSSAPCSAVSPIKPFLPERAHSALPSPAKKRKLDSPVRKGKRAASLSPTKLQPGLANEQNNHLTSRYESTLRLRNAWADITHRHESAPPTSVQMRMGRTRALREEDDDIVDLRTMEIVVDRGVLRRAKPGAWAIGSYVGIGKGEDVMVVDDALSGDDAEQSENGEDGEDEGVFWEEQEDSDGSDELGGWDDLVAQPSLAYREAKQKKLEMQGDLAKFFEEESRLRRQFSSTPLPSSPAPGFATSDEVEVHDSRGPIAFRSSNIVLGKEEAEQLARKAFEASEDELTSMKECPSPSKSHLKRRSTSPSKSPTKRRSSPSKSPVPPIERHRFVSEESSLPNELSFPLLSKPSSPPSKRPSFEVLIPVRNRAPLSSSSKSRPPVLAFTPCDDDDDDVAVSSVSRTIIPDSSTPSLPSPKSPPSEQRAWPAHPRPPLVPPPQDEEISADELAIDVRPRARSPLKRRASPSKPTSPGSTPRQAAASSLTHNSSRTFTHPASPPRLCTPQLNSSPFKRHTPVPSASSSRYRLEETPMPAAIESDEDDPLLLSPSKASSSRRRRTVSPVKRSSPAKSGGSGGRETPPLPKRKRAEHEDESEDGEDPLLFSPGRKKPSPVRGRAKSPEKKKSRAKSPDLSIGLDVSEDELAIR